MTNESRVTCLAGKERSWESRGFGRRGSSGSFSLLAVASTGVMASRKDSSKSRVEEDALSARLETGGLVLDGTGGFRRGGVSGTASRC